MVPSYSLVIWLPKTPKSHRSPVAPSSRKLWFSEDTQFWPKYSNGPGVAKSWQISKVTIRCHKRCLKLSWVQIWQKNSNGKCPKLPIRSAHSLRYIGGLSVNLNHLKSGSISFGHSNSLSCRFPVILDEFSGCVFKDIAANYYRYFSFDPVWSSQDPIWLYEYPYIRNDHAPDGDVAGKIPAK